MIAATADIHSPKYLPLFSKALNSLDLNSCELFIIAGDIVAKGNVGEAKHVFSLIESKFKGPVIAVFGNEDYEELEDKFRALYPKVVWLNEEYYDVELAVGKVRVIGSRGALDKPTTWQRKHIPNILEKYEERIRKIEELVKQSPYPTILVTHYAPTYATLKGEPVTIWPQMGTRKLERIIKKYRPLAVIHGHAHNGKVLQAKVGNVPVYNVSLPAFKKIITIKLKKQDTLTKFFA